MVSNRSRASERSTASAAPADTSSQALEAFARRAARILIASCSAAAMTFTGWAVTALPRAAAHHVDARVARAWTNN
jgi:hypothetical protein